MSPPGKRRHNELNAAPPPETPRRTGKPGETNNRDVVHSGESFCVRAKKCLLSEPRGNESVSGETENRSSVCGTTGHLPLKGKAIITSALLCYFLSKKVDVSFLLPTTTVIAAAAAITAAAMQRIAAASGFFAGSFS